MKYVRITTLLAAAVCIAACADKPDAAPQAAASAQPEGTTPPVGITVHAKNYSFAGMPDTIAGGVVTFTLVNDGAPEVHHIAIMRFRDGHTKEQYLDSIKAGKSPLWAEGIGGPNVTSVAGKTTQATVSLEPGQYTMFCFVPSPDHVPHVMKGMMKDFVVTPGASPVAAFPDADVTIRLADYNFAVTPALTAGHHVVRVQNDATQDHEVVIVRLNAGKTPDDVVHFVENMQGAPPGDFIGGVSGMGKGVVNQFDVDLAAGDYALICFLPDAKDGKMHAVHGMTQLIHVS